MKYKLAGNFLQNEIYKKKLLVDFSMAYFIRKFPTNFFARNFLGILNLQEAIIYEDLLMDSIQQENLQETCFLQILVKTMHEIS